MIDFCPGHSLHAGCYLLVDQHALHLPILATVKLYLSSCNKLKYCLTTLAIPVQCRPPKLIADSKHQKHYLLDYFSHQWIAVCMPVFSDPDCLTMQLSCPSFTYEMRSMKSKTWQLKCFCSSRKIKASTVFFSFTQRSGKLLQSGNVCAQQIRAYWHESWIISAIFRNTLWTKDI